MIMKKSISFTEWRNQMMDKQVEPLVGLSCEKYTEAKDDIFNKEEELFYRTTYYRGS